MSRLTPLVVKFGGSTFLNGHSDYKRIAEYLIGVHREHSMPIIAVVSAPPGATEAARGRIHQVNPNAGAKYAATLFSLPDTESAVLLAAAVEASGTRADALNSHQNGIVTDRTPLWSRIQSVDTALLWQALEDADILCVASGHGADSSGRFTWMGKNSGDLSALIIASAIGADTVEIYSDVDGVYTADPRLVSDVRLLPELSYDVARTMASRGAKVLDRRALDVARAHGITIKCRVNHGDYHIGTTVTGEVSHMRTAVIIDTKSVVLGAATPEDADLTLKYLLDRGLSCIRVEDGDYKNVVVVTGGYTDIEALMARREVPAEITGARLVSVVRCRHASDYIVENTNAAIDLGRELHRQSETFTTT
ncbi:aspartate kinase [Rhodococcus fascians]|nr:aspartate kinase [Rhodococcus fascians]